jgi:hypothetical protein
VHKAWNQEAKSLSGAGGGNATYIFSGERQWHDHALNGLQAMEIIPAETLRKPSWENLAEFGEPAMWTVRITHFNDLRCCLVCNRTLARRQTAATSFVTGIPDWKASTASTQEILAQGRPQKARKFQRGEEPAEEGGQGLACIWGCGYDRQKC